MITIYKYPLEIVERQSVEMPLNATPLTVQVQRDQLCLWCVVNTDQDVAPERRKVYIVGTGHPAGHVWKPGIKYVATVQTHGGSLVWHVFIQ